MKDEYVWHLKYSPDQARVPAGSPEGGQFTSGSGNVPKIVQHDELGRLRGDVAAQITPELANHLLNAGAYSRTVERLFDGFYDGKPRTADELLAMSVEEINRLTSKRYS